MIFIVLGVCCVLAAVATAMAQYAGRADAYYAEHPTDDPTDANPYGRPPGRGFRLGARILFWVAIAAGVVASFWWTLAGDLPF